MSSKKSIDTSETLDATDLKVLEILRQDGRATFAEIAGQLEVSPGTIRQRYNRLVDQGYLKVVRTDGNHMLKVADKIAKLKEVVYLVVVSGRYDIMLEVFCRDHEDLLNFVTEKLYAIDGVRETETFMHLKIVKEIYF